MCIRDRYKGEGKENPSIMFCIYAIIINIPEVLFFPFNNGKKGGQAGEENKNQAYGSQGEGIFCEIPFVARVGSIQEGDSQRNGKVPEHGRQAFAQCTKDGGCLLYTSRCV